LQQHVLHRKVGRDRAAIILGLRFRTRIAMETDAMAFVNLLCDQSACISPRVARLCVGRLESGYDYKETRSERGEPHFAKHGSPLLKKSLARKQDEKNDRNGLWIAALSRSTGK
jgi:hypothetical protein